eukprot:CAMPEP_0202460906 /NCGR_PEP_ID=MMETSP1360-20130828/46549_1 /ASSEMBLY_ACC=CAM_ASM_000848 /TAXON_ID=515479 /ORGANISM="Licmophora paradoxa, Strain CCMP2313" /LENGTH=83 /DNA_ID=CAMNT_0049082755 /DNA_START=75 /DNA_END=326 /DNA_ORIENTATION=-
MSPSQTLYPSKLKISFVGLYISMNSSPSPDFGVGNISERTGRTPVNCASTTCAPKATTNMSVAVFIIDRRLSQYPCTDVRPWE